MTKIFVYGSLCDEHTRKIILGREVPNKSDKLRGFAKENHSVLKVYPTIKKHLGASVDGLVLDVGDYDFNILDRYETTLYKKIKVNLESGENALAYIENHKD